MNAAPGHVWAKMSSDRAEESAVTDSGYRGLAVTDSGYRGPTVTDGGYRGPAVIDGGYRGPTVADDGHRRPEDRSRASSVAGLREAGS